MVLVHRHFFKPRNVVRNNMKKIIKIILCLIISNNIFGQNSVFKLNLNDKSKLKNELSKSIGENWNLLEYTIEDINNDKKEDIIVIGNSSIDKELNRKIYIYS